MADLCEDGSETQGSLKAIENPLQMAIVYVMNEAGDIQRCCGPNFLAFALRLRKTPEKLNQEIQPDRESNPGPLRKRPACWWFNC
ncbi:hypothetical protein ANN_00823 [Periplaneta americana]|uniref:Uncharacterized protein n=1 Tax=Periplaneta americana TaxID=6978 RepID=A0ABQ8TRV0_PERAM|nr:hypothetical protein ANN_00823 [Periplaneta americana]